jgi:lipopolysaccharide transport LptD-like protein
MCGRWVAVVIGCAVSLSAFAAQPADAPKSKTPPERKELVRADRQDYDHERGIYVVVGNVRFMPPGEKRIIAADAGVVWIDRQEAYFEGNIRIYHTLGPATAPADFHVPPPKPGERTGLAPNETIEKAGDIDDVIRSKGEKRAIIIDTRVAVSEAERVYVNWGDGTAYLVKPKLRFAQADRVANWVVTAPSAEGIATYNIPVKDKNGKLTGKFEKQRHFVLKNATFTACMFKDPHTRITTTTADIVEGDRVKLKNALFQFGDVPILYLPALYKDYEHDWPWVEFAYGTSTRRGTFVSMMFRAKPVKGMKFYPRVEYMAERGVSYGLDGKYSFHGDAVRGALEAVWIPNDTGTDDLADVSNLTPPWPVMAADPALGTDNRYRIYFWHQQETPQGVEFDLEVHKLSDAGVYREYFEEKFKTEKDPETRALLKYGRNNWAVFIHAKKRINDFLTQTEYLPQIGFNMIAQPVGGGFLFTTDTEVARVIRRYGDVRQLNGQPNARIVRIWTRRNEYSMPPALTLRQNDSDKLESWRFDTVNIISRPFEWGVFDIEPYVGWRGTWYQHGIKAGRGGYMTALPPTGPAVPAGIAALPMQTGSTSRSQILAGGRIATQFHRVYDVSDRPALQRYFRNGMRHIVTPEIFYTYAGTPSKKPRYFPEHDAVSEEDGLHRITFGLRNRWQTKWPPELKRDPAAPLGGEWFRRKRAAELARFEDPVDVIDLDAEIDLFLNRARDNVHPRGTGVRRLSNLRTDLTVRPSRKTSVFLNTEFAIEDAGSGGAGGFEQVDLGLKHQARPDLMFAVSHSYHFHDESVLRFASDWEMNPRWHIRFDLQQDFSGGGGWDRTVVISRRFHEWELTFAYEFDRGARETITSFQIGPTRARMQRPSWRFQPRSVAAFELAETAR